MMFLSLPFVILFTCCLILYYTVKGLSLIHILNALAIEIGKFLLQNGKYLLPDTGRLLKRKENFVRAFDELPGYSPVPSETSFFLIHTIHKSHVLKQELLKQFGILIRDASNFRGLDEHYFQMCIRDSRLGDHRCNNPLKRGTTSFRQVHNSS